jgi:hypothetical protein
MSAVYGADGKSRRVLVPSVKVEPLAQGDEGNWKKALKAINALVEQGVRNAPNLPLGYAEFEDIEVTGKPGVPHKLYLRHGFGSRVRWWIDGVRAYLPRYDHVTQSFVNRELCLGTQTSGVGASTLGARYRMKTAREIVGVRFAWIYSGASRTVTARIYNDTSGATLGTVDVECANTGVYCGLFSAPITTDLTGTDITASIYNAFNTSYTTDVSWVGGVTQLGPDVTLKDPNLQNAGNARPTALVGGISAMVEPIFGRSGPMFEEHNDTDENTLVLNAHDAGKFTFRVTPAGT